MGGKFNLTDEESAAAVALIEAHAKAKGLSPEDYVRQRIAGVVHGLELPQDALYQIQQGDFGPVYEEFKGNFKGAIEKLKEIKDGEAPGALMHRDIPEGIDLVWGKEGTLEQRYSDGYGLAKIIKKHPEAAERLQEILDTAEIKTRSENRINMESDRYKIGIRLDWNGKSKTWLITAFEKRTGPETTSDTFRVAGIDDTARYAADSSDLNIPPSEGGVNTLEQRHQEKAVGDSVTKGAVQFLEDGRAVIHAFKSADITTVVHELGHIWRQETAGEDLAILEKWAGVQVGKWEVRHEKKVAKNFERYLAEGKAPAEELKPVFERMKQWIIEANFSARLLPVFFFRNDS